MSLWRTPLFPSVRCKNRFWAEHGFGSSRSRKGSSVNKTQLIDALSARYEGNRKQAQHALDSVIDVIQRELVKGEKVAITGFGSFERRVREARMVRNPRTGERIRAKKTAVPKFTAGADLKALVSGAKKLPKPTEVAQQVADAAMSAPAARKAVAAAKKAASSTTTKRTTKKATKKTAKKAAKKTPAKKSPAKKTAKKATKKSPAKKTAKKASPAKKSTAKKTTAKRTAK